MKTVYVETTILSYLAARPSREAITAGHQELTRRWWANRRDDYELYISEAVIAEMQQGDPDAARRRLQLAHGIPELPVTDEARNLAKRYRAEVRRLSRAVLDSIHLAVATTAEIDYLLTWNCRHLAHAEIQDEIARLHVKWGYVGPRVCTPEELIYVGD